MRSSDGASTDFNDSGEFEVVDEATTLLELKNKIHNTIDVIVMDLSMPGGFI